MLSTEFGGHISKWLPSPPLVRRTRFFSDIHCENLVGFQEVKVCPWPGLQEFLSLRLVHAQSLIISELPFRYSYLMLGPEVVSRCFLLQVNCDSLYFSVSQVFRVMVLSCTSVLSWIKAYCFQFFSIFLFLFFFCILGWKL